MRAQDNGPPPVEPERPSADDCCKGSCDPCIFDRYDAALDRYQVELRAWNEREAAVAITAAADRPAARVIDDEADIPACVLPDALVCADGTRVADAETWRAKRRPELLEAFASQVYGRTPRSPIALRIDRVTEHGDALGGKAVMRQARLRVGRDSVGERGGVDGHRRDRIAERGAAIDLLLFVPKARQPAAAFLGLNFFGNQAVDADPRIDLCRSWLRDVPDKGIFDHRATERSRGVEASRWPVAAIVDRGFALVTACCADIDPDFDDGFQNGIHPLFDDPDDPDAPDKPGRRSDQWGSIGAWAWGLSRALDALGTIGGIDTGRVALVGHSRLGKAALWAAAQDERFAAVISNASGRGGSSLARRRFGETIRHINAAFPHWFCENFRHYDDREDALPVDQHELIALIAPRSVLICSAEGDAWADPRGEFLAALAAAPVYRLLDTDGLAVDRMPPPRTPVLSTIGYHIRHGGHDVTAEDWAVFLDFAERQLIGSRRR